MAVSLLAANGYRIAKSWQYEDNFPEPPLAPMAAAAAESSSVGGGGGLLQQCVAGQDSRKESLESRPLIDGAPMIKDKDKDGYVRQAGRRGTILSPYHSLCLRSHCWPPYSYNVASATLAQGVLGLANFSHKESLIQL